MIFSLLIFLYRRGRGKERDGQGSGAAVKLKLLREMKNSHESVTRSAVPSALEGVEMAF